MASANTPTREEVAIFTAALLSAPCTLKTSNNVGMI